MTKANPLSAEKQALLKLRLRGGAGTPAGVRRVPTRASNDPAPLSFAQFYIWAGDRKAPGNPTHNLPVGFRIKGRLDARFLEESFNAIVRRHEALRTTFAVKDGEPVQVIHPECRIKIALIETESEIELQRLARQDSVEPFDISRLPLFRVSLYRLAETDHVLVVNLHHIIADGISIGPLLNELDALYQALKSGAEPELPALPVQYADFATWTRREFLEGPYPEQAEYWRARMNGRLRPLALPYDRERPAVRSFAGANVFCSIPKRLVEGPSLLDPQAGASFFSIALALLQVVLQRHSRSEDMLILTPVSIRSEPELRPLIGNFLNLIPLRCDVSGDPSFSELVRRSRETTLDALSNKDLPFDKIVDGMRIERDSGRDPLFQVLLQVLPATGARLADLEVTSFQVDHGFSQFDLSLHLYEHAEGYLGRFEYSTELFDAATVEGLSSSFVKLLEAVVADPQRPISALPLPGAAERKALPAPERSAGAAAYVAPQSVLQKRIAQVWCEMLQLEQVGVHQNFFDVGGHSLLLVKTCARLCAELGRELRVVDLFTYPTIEALARYLGEGTPAPVQPRSVSTVQAEPIAIVGMAGRFPGARDIESFWENLRAGKESITFFSAEEMREAGVPEAVLSDPNYVGALGYLEDADKFDAAFFGYSAREADTIDPQQRLLLECAAETLERAGYDPDRYPGSIGVYAGASMNTYLSGMEQSNPPGSPGRLSTLLGSGRDFLTTRLSYKLNLRGPSMNVQTACSTSLVAVHQACRALRDYECDMALAGGVSVALPLKSGNLYMPEGMFSPDGRCRAFDAGANGTVMGNGVAFVLLKRLSDALADGDHIHAVIRGTAVNNDGSSKVGYTAPSVEAEAKVIAAAQASAQCDPDTVGYVETHGTGTLLGDPIEVAALKRAFGDGRGRRSACSIGSLKSNIGHLDVAAGVAGLIKTALSLEHRELVPSLHFKQPNPQIDFAAGPFQVNAELRQWESRDGTPRRAGVSSFGFGGTNAHAVLEEAPPPQASGPSREWQVLCLSAKTDAALAEAAANLARHLREHPEINLADAAYTLQVGRREFAHRGFVVCRDAADVQPMIRGTHRGGKRPVHFMFTGQGAQYPNMGLGLYRTEAVFRETVDRCCDRLHSSLGLDLREVLFPAEGALEQAAERLRRTELTQPALFVVEYALAKLWVSLGIQPAGMIGHSVGEYVAACVAGVMSLDDALDLVAERGRLMGQMPPGAMLAVPLPESEVLALLGEKLSLATVNGPTLCVVAGPQADIEALEARLAESGLAPRRLHTSHAFHSAMMDPILEPFTERVRRIALKAPQLPYISNVTGQWISAEQATDPAYYATHLRQAVQFGKGVEQLLADPNSVFLEVGPGNTLATLAKRHPARGEGHAFIASMRHPDVAQADEALLMESVGRLWLAGAQPDWQALHAGSRRRRVRLPTYPFQRQRHWFDTGSERGATAGPPAMARKPDIADWLYVPSWKRAPGPVAGRSAQASRWLIFADESGWAEKLARRLTGEGDLAVMVYPGRAFEERRNRLGFSIDPGNAEHYERLFTALRDKRQLPTRIVHLWALTGETLLDRCFWSPACIAKAVGRVASGEAFEITLISEGLQEVTGDEAPSPLKATLLGPCRVIPQEYPGVACRSVDVVLPEPGSRRERLLLDQLHAELHSPCVDPLVAYRGIHRWVRSYAAARLAAPDGPPLRLRERGVYLITGGLGGIGLAIAEHLAKTFSARLILVGRTAPQEAKISRIRALEGSGAQVMVAAADVADREQMAKVVKAAQGRFGAIQGVVHAAGVPAGGIIELKTPEAAAAILASKVQGTMVLDDLFGDARLDFMVLCSSLSAVLGGAGQVDYTAANAFLDAFAQARTRSERGFTASIAWDSWNETGMAVDVAASSNLSELRRRDLEAGIGNAQAIEVFRRILDASMPHVLVSTRELEGRIDQWSGGEKRHAGESETAGSTPASTAHPRPTLSSPYEAPRTESERVLAELWGKMLGVDQVGIHDNFFELGGDSVLSIQIIVKLRAIFGLDLPLRNLIERPTVGALAQAIDGLQWLKEKKAPVSGAAEREEIEF